MQFKRLLYPQFAWDLVVLVVILLQFDMYGNQLIGETSTLTIKNIYHFITSTWYLWCVFFCGIFTVLAYKTTKPLVWLACFCILMFVFYDYLPDVFFKHQQIAMQLPFFVFGVVVHQMKDGNLFMRKMLWPSLVGYLVCWGVYLCMDCNFGGFPTFPKFLWAVFGVVLMYNVFKYMFHMQIANSMLQNFGGYTLGIYIIHTRINTYIVRAYSDFTIDTGYLLVDYIVCILYSVLLLYSSIVVTIAIRKNRTLRKYLLGEK